MALGQRTIGVANGPHAAPASIGPGGPVDIPYAQTLQAPASSAGVAQLTFQLQQQGSYAEVELVVVQCDAGTPAARVYAGDPSPANLRDFTDDASENVAFEQPPIFVNNGVVNVVFTGAPAGALCIATLQYRVKG